MTDYTLLYKIEALTTGGYYIALIDSGRIIQCENIEEAKDEMLRVKCFYTRNKDNKFTEISVGRTRLIDERMANGSLINAIFKTAKNLSQKMF